MAHKTPLVEGVFLVDPGCPRPRVVVDSAEWYRWLASAGSFAVAGVNGRYTARKDRRGPNDGYWRAYRKFQGRLASVYLGRSAELSLDRLQHAAAELGLEVVSLPAAAAPGGAALEAGAAGGTLTFLLVDDGDPRPAAPLASQQSDAAAQLAQIIADTLTALGGEPFLPAPAAFGGAFTDVLAAVAAAVSIQRQSLAAVQTGQAAQLPRMAIHAGVSTRQHGTYVGQPVDWCLQLLASAHPGQILLSHVTRALLDHRLPGDVAAAELGVYWMGSSHQPEQLFQLLGADLPAVRLPPHSPARRPSNLPVPATPLVGREPALAEALASMRREGVRLLTLTGPGGVGKTRLGLQIALALREHFADGVFFVDLAAVSSPAFVASTIAQTLELSPEAGQTIMDRLTIFLAPRRLLLLLDNFEQLLAASVTLTALLAAAPGLKLLVTSRAPLHLSSEHEFPVRPLELPANGKASDLSNLGRSGAVAVFAQRAQAVNPGFALTVETAPAVVEICRRLDGLPLAIELAATRCRLFSPEALLQRLERRLPLLTGGASDLPARQRTLRDTIDWSYQLLDDAAQALLRRFAVFAGGAALEAVEAICGSDEAAPRLDCDLLPVIEQLIDQSLLRPAADGSRFVLLETIREFALEGLEQSGEALSLSRRHAYYYLDLAEQIAPTLHGPEVGAGLDRLAPEHANVRTALAWSLAQGEGELAARLASAMLVFWDVRPHRREGREWLEAALAAHTPLAPATRARALHAAGHLARALYDLDAALRLLEESRSIFRQLGDQRAETAALTDIGWTLALLGGDTQQAAGLLRDGLARYRAMGNLHGTAWALQALGWIEHSRALGYPQGIPSPLAGLSWVARRPDSLAAARALHAESLALRRKTGDVYELGWSLMSLGVIAAVAGEYVEAQAYQEERLEVERSLNNNHGICSALQQLGVIALRQGQLAVARTRLEESLARAGMLGEASITAFALVALGELALAEGDRAQAAARLNQALATFGQRSDHQRLARVYALLAQIATQQGDESAALEQIGHCLRIARAIDDPALLGAGLAYLGDGAARGGEPAWAALLWGAADGCSRPLSRVRAQPYGYQRLVAEARAALGSQGFAAIWAEGLGLAPEAAIAARNRIRAATPAGRLAPPARLTRREAEVLALLAEGLSNAEIAERLVISPATVKTYLSTIYHKLGVRSRTAAVRSTSEQSS